MCTYLVEICPLSALDLDYNARNIITPNSLLRRITWHQSALRNDVVTAEMHLKLRNLVYVHEALQFDVYMSGGRALAIWECLICAQTTSYEEINRHSLNPSVLLQFSALNDFFPPFFLNRLGLLDSFPDTSFTSQITNLIFFIFDIN